MALFKPLELGSITLQHRIVLAPCTRLRAKCAAENGDDGIFVPYELNVEYYSQRATPGGLLITEACPISRTAAGYKGCAGIFTPSQIKGWKKVTDAVHAKGGYIFCQLWHVGRATVSSLINDESPLSCTNVPIKGDSPMPNVKYSDSPPKSMTKSDIQDVIKDYSEAAKNAINLAGFDGVEIHGANGYLIDQFLHDNVNNRTDEYGGSFENRSRFALEVIDAVTKSVGTDKTSIRLSPFNYFQDTHDSNPVEMWNYLCDKIASKYSHSPLAYVSMVEPRFDEVLNESEKLNSLDKNNKSKSLSLDSFRDILKKSDIKFIAAGNFNAKNSIQKLESNKADAIAFGRYFISNPDLVYRLKNNLPLTKYDRSTFYGASPPQMGYTTYKTYEEENQENDLTKYNSTNTSGVKENSIKVAA